MKKNNVAETVDPHVAEAASWRARLTEIGVETMPEFESWLAEPGHAEAWSKVANLWDYFGEQANETELLTARRSALGDMSRASARRDRPPYWRQIGFSAGAAAALVVAVMAGYSWLNGPDDYMTAIGERRIVTLSDGSRVSLDSDSEVTVRYSRTARELYLLKGQARFDVAHNVERPFSVSAGDEKVIATGTAFNIDITGPKVTVTLIEGHVVVVNEDAPNHAPQLLQPVISPRPSIDLKVGQQLVAVPEKPPEIVLANLSHVTAWTSGQLTFDNEPLAEVVARISRYSTTRIVVADAKAGRLRISGDFNSSDVSGFVDGLTRYLPVEAVATGSGEVALKSKE